MAYEETKRPQRLYVEVHGPDGTFMERVAWPWRRRPQSGRRYIYRGREWTAVNVVPSWDRDSAVQTWQVVLDDRLL